MFHEKELVLFMRQANYISKMFEKSYIHIFTLLNSKSTDIPKYWLTLSDIHCTLTVPHCTFHWLPLYPTVHFYWTALYSTVHHCTVILTSTVPHCTPLYRALTITVPHCTTLYWAPTITVPHCTALYY